MADLLEASHADPRIVDPDDYGHAQGIGRKLRSDGVRGILYPSVRHPSGECLAAFSTALLKNCLHAAYLEYNWNGQGIDAVFEVSQLL
ncbi:MAG: RES family NAD+ phosphorylase [Thiobacillus sp.]